MKKQVIIIAGLFIVFFLIVFIASNFAVSPEEPADAKTADIADIIPEDAELWEYKVVPFPSGSVNSIEALFNEYGKTGWEYVDTISRVVIFKRRLNQ